MDTIKKNDQKSELAKILGNSNIEARAARDTRKFKSGDVDRTTLDERVEKTLDEQSKSGHKVNKDFFAEILNTIAIETNVNNELTGSTDKTDDSL
jgi:hypothetical protein